MHPERLSKLQQDNAIPQGDAIPQSNATQGNALPQDKALPQSNALLRASAFPPVNALPWLKRSRHVKPFILTNPLPFGAVSPPRALGTTRSTDPLSGGIMNPPPPLSHRTASANPLPASSSNQKQP